MSTFEPVYNPETCVHASELRARGFKIPDSIPDVAWVPEGSWTVVGPVSVEVDEDEPTMFHFDLGELVFTQPFRWIEGKFVVQKQCSHCGSMDKPVIPDADAYDFYCNECGLKLAGGEDSGDDEKP